MTDSIEKSSENDGPVWRGVGLPFERTAAYVSQV
jgi:hypothetical protein